MGCSGYFGRRPIGGFRTLRVYWGDEGELRVRKGGRSSFSTLELEFG